MDEYLRFLSAYFGADEVSVYARLFAIIDQVELEQYEQNFGAIIAHSEFADTATVCDEWHMLSIQYVKTISEALGIFFNNELPLSKMLDILEVIISIEFREDKSEIDFILEDDTLDNKEKLVSVISFFSVIDEFDIRLGIDRVNNACIRGLTHVSVESGDLFDDIEPTLTQPPLAKNIRYLINDNPNFIILEEVKSGLAFNLTVENYLSLYWSKIEKLKDTKLILRELCAIVLISDTPPHEMLAKLREIFAGKFTDIQMVRTANNLINSEFMPILAQKT